MSLCNTRAAARGTEPATLAGTGTCEPRAISSSRTNSLIGCEHAIHARLRSSVLRAAVGRGLGEGCHQRNRQRPWRATWWRLRRAASRSSGCERGRLQIQIDAGRTWPIIGVRTVISHRGAGRCAVAHLKSRRGGSLPSALVRRFKAQVRTRRTRTAHRLLLLLSGGISVAHLLALAQLPAQREPRGGGLLGFTSAARPRGAIKGRPKTLNCRWPEDAALKVREPSWHG